MAYRVEYARSVAKDLKGVPVAVRAKALAVVEAVLAQDPRSGTPLTGPHKGLWKYRVGDYRIVYTIEKDRLCILVLRIRHRKDVYSGTI